MLVQLLLLLQNKGQRALNKKTMHIDQVYQWKKRLSSLTGKQRAQLKGMPHDRANILLAGVILLEQLMHFLKIKEYILSTFGLRHALLYSKSSLF